jgi:hypothetical protein
LFGDAKQVNLKGGEHSLELVFGGEPIHVYYPYLNRIQRIQLEHASAYKEWRSAAQKSRTNALAAESFEKLLAESLDQPVLEGGALASWRSVVKSQASGTACSQGNANSWL